MTPPWVHSVRTWLTGEKGVGDLPLGFAASWYPAPPQRWGNGNRNLGMPAVATDCPAKGSFRLAHCNRNHRHGLAAHICMVVKA